MLAALSRLARMVRTVRFTAKLSAAQHRRLDDVLGMNQQLYNAGLEQWRDGYKRWKANPDPRRAKPKNSLYDNFKQLTQLRAADPAWAALDVKVARGTLKRLQRTVDAWFDSDAVAKAAGNPRLRRGYPRFKARRRWRSIAVPDAHNGMLLR